MDKSTLHPSLRIRVQTNSTPIKVTKQVALCHSRAWEEPKRISGPNLLETGRISSEISKMSFFIDKVHCTQRSPRPQLLSTTVGAIHQVIAAILVSLRQDLTSLEFTKQSSLSF